MCSPSPVAIAGAKRRRSILDDEPPQSSYQPPQLALLSPDITLDAALLASSPPAAALPCRQHSARRGIRKTAEMTPVRASCDVPSPGAAFSAEDSLSRELTGGPLPDELTVDA